jgi:hypothetical protein
MIKLHTDHHFYIGHTHIRGGTPCQGYATSGVIEGMAYAVISDGCSTGGETDVGSRLVALSTKSAIKESWAVNKQLLDNSKPHEIALAQRVMLSGVSESLGLVRNDLLATVVYAWFCSKGGFIHVRGDGVVATKYRNGRIQAVRFDWADNTPFYPAYVSDNYVSFINVHGGDTQANKLQAIVCNINPDGQKKDDKDVIMYTSLEEGIRGIVIPYEEKELTDIEYIAVFSDGVTQIENVDWVDAVHQLMAFKVPNGMFVTRKLNAALKKFKDNGNGPLDDLAYSVIRIEHEEVNKDGG